MSEEEMKELSILKLAYGNFVSLDDYVNLQTENTKLKEQIRFTLLGILEDISLRMQYDKRNKYVYDKVYEFVAEQYNEWKLGE